MTWPLKIQPRFRYWDLVSPNSTNPFGSLPKELSLVLVHSISVRTSFGFWPLERISTSSPTSTKRSQSVSIEVPFGDRFLCLSDKGSELHHPSPLRTNSQGFRRFGSVRYFLGDRSIRSRQFSRFVTIRTRNTQKVSLLFFDLTRKARFL